MSKSLPPKNLPPPCPETRVAEAFGVIARNPIFAEWTREDMDLAFVGALAAQVSQQAAQEAVSVLRSLRDDVPDEALRRGGMGRNVLRFSSMSAAQAQIPNQGRLPVRRGAQALQNPDGSFVPVPGYNT